MTEVFNKECSLALKLGMSYEQYWVGEPQIMLNYAELYKQNQRETFMEKDTLAWLVGSYVNVALAQNLSAAFGKKGQSNKIKYPEKPMFIDDFDENAKVKKQERELRKSYGNFLAAVHSMGFSISEAAS